MAALKPSSGLILGCMLPGLVFWATASILVPPAESSRQAALDGNCSTEGFASGRPVISVFEKEFDLGKVDEGQEFRHSFKIRNEGDKPLIIKTAFSTCGCTVPTIKRREIPPGEEGDLEVLLDTAMKQGHVSKPIEIRSNDPVTPVTTIYIKANVRSPHADLTDAKAKIFTGRCAACHVEKGKGKQGEELYVADCALCHGFRAQGIPGVAPGLISMDYNLPDVSKAMKQIICFGSPSHRSMAGYLDKAGGPLSEKDIDSLIVYLHKLSNQKQQQEQVNRETTKSGLPVFEQPDDHLPARADLINLDGRGSSGISPSKNRR